MQYSTASTPDSAVPSANRTVRPVTMYSVIGGLSILVADVWFTRKDSDFWDMMRGVLQSGWICAPMSIPEAELPTTITFFPA